MAEKLHETHNRVSEEVLKTISKECGGDINRMLVVVESLLLGAALLKSKLAPITPEDVIVAISSAAYVRAKKIALTESAQGTPN